MKLALFALAGVSGCSALLHWGECRRDEDCDAHVGGIGYCTSDHLCVESVPEERLCSERHGAVDAAAPAIAALFRLSGPSGGKDNLVANALRLALDEVNQLRSVPLRLIFCDTAGDPEQARRAFERAVRVERAFAVVGPSTSGELLNLVDLARRHDVLILSPSATAPSIADLDDGGLIWRTAGSDALQAEVLASQITSSSGAISTAAVSTLYGKGLAKEFVEALLPRTVTPHEFAEGTPGDEVASALSADRPEAALIVADADAPNWVAALSDRVGLTTTRFLLTDGAKSSSLFLLGPATAVLDRIIGTAPGIPLVSTPSGAAFQVFQTSYEAAFGGIDPSTTAYVPNAYDAFYAIAIAIAAVPERPLTGHRLAEAMGKLSSPGGSFNVGQRDYLQAVGALSGGMQIDLQGTSGPIDFDPQTGDVRSAPIDIWTIDTAAPTTNCFGEVPPGTVCYPFRRQSTVTP